MNRQRARRRLALLGALAASCAGVTWSVPGQAAAAEVCDNFVASAASDAVRTGVFSPGFLLVEGADVSTPTAQAYVDALGQSRGLGAAPYPGDTVLSTAALGGVEQSSYPLAAMSQYPTKTKAGVDNPAVQLSARSAERESAGSASAGGTVAEGVAAVARTTAHAEARCTARGSVEADADTYTKGLSVADGVLEVGALHTEAHAVRSPGAEPELTSSLEAANITVAGQKVELTDDGLAVAGTGVPLPGNPLLAPLDEAGISVSYVAAVKDADGKGITSPGLRISLTREVTGTGPTEITYTLGRSYARTSGSDDASSFPPESQGSDDVPAPTETTDEPSTAASGGGSPPPPATGGSPPVDAAPPGESPVPVAASGGGDSLQPVSFQPADFTARWLYLEVVAGGAALLLSGLVVRIFGVRLGWT